MDSPHYSFVNEGAFLFDYFLFKLYVSNVLEKLVFEEFLVYWFCAFDNDFVTISSLVQINNWRCVSWQTAVFFCIVFSWFWVASHHCSCTSSLWRHIVSKLCNHICKSNMRWEPTNIKSLRSFMLRWQLRARFAVTFKSGINRKDMTIKEIFSCAVTCEIDCFFNRSVLIFCNQIGRVLFEVWK